jgi:transcriptional regulator with XRE-family HTH domain
MAKRALQSTAFAEWVRKTRDALGKNQSEITKDITVLSQQDWSRIERLGLVPSEEKLEALCSALGKTVPEAKRLIQESAATDQRTQIFERDFQEFVDFLVDGASNAQESPLRVFVVREDSEQVNDTTVELHDQILSVEGNLELYLLFRYSDSTYWRSFSYLAGALLKRREHEGQDSQTKLISRFKGFYRRPDQEENRSLALPMIYPIVLVLSATEPSLYFYSYDPKIYEAQKQAGKTHNVAQQKSTILLSGDNRNAMQVASWIGLNGPLGLDPALWTPISWPELPAAFESRQS